MNKKQTSGHCRSTAFFLFIFLVLCVTAASAATLNSNLVVSRATLQIATTTAPVYATCPAGYDCMTDADATSQLGSYAKYSDAVCGYKQSTTAVALIKAPQYCVKKTETQYPAICPAGCSCMMESAAKEKFGMYSRCSESPCYTVVTGSAQVNAYCFRQSVTTTTITPTVSTCPVGCICLSDVTAKARYGDYTRCTSDVCGFEQGSLTNALASNQVAKYCVKEASTTSTCPEGCSCISEATAKAKGGTWSRCSADICGYEQSTATLAAVVQVPKYCMKQQETTPACPDGCACISDEDAKLKGLTQRCDTSQTPCGYRSVDATANTAAQRIPLYCYKVAITATTTPKVCPEGCYCIQEADAKAKFGPNNYTRCTSDICGYDPSATTANGIPKYCFRPTVTVAGTPAPAVCPQGCTCTTDAVAKEKGLTACRGTRTSCGYDEKTQQTLYCFEQVPSPTCVYDYQKNVCSGTCAQGYICGLLASEKDATGKVTYAVCGCTGQTTTPCAYDVQKNACTGTCANQQSCAIVGKNVDERTGAITPVCGCPQQSSCSYNYDKEACVGTCTVTGENCQLNTIYRDPTTGKVTYAECHCKGSGDTTPTCACDAASGSCTGTCADGKACSMTERTTDNAGKVVCKSCGCIDTCVLNANNECTGTCANQQTCARIVTKDDSGQEKVSCGCSGTLSQVAARQPGILESIGSFFNRLLGGK
jgi:hypothetical protein